MHKTWDLDDLQPSFKPSVELEANLKCLRDCAHTDRRFRADLKALERVRADCRWIDEALENKRTCESLMNPNKTRFKICFDALRLEAATKEIGVRERIQIGRSDSRLIRIRL